MARAFDRKSTPAAQTVDANPQSNAFKVAEAHCDQTPADGLSENQASQGRAPPSVDQVLAVGAFCGLGLCFEGLGFGPSVRGFRLYICKTLINLTGEALDPEPANPTRVLAVPPVWAGVGAANGIHHERDTRAVLLGRAL